LLLIKPQKRFLSPSPYAKEAVARVPTLNPKVKLKVKVISLEMIPQIADIS
jgi:hypothetical protein